MFNRLFILLDDTGTVQPRPTFKQECALMFVRGFVVVSFLSGLYMLAAVKP